MPLLPVALNLTGRRVLVVGGGSVARRKVEALRECGALITVVAPEITFEFSGVECHARPFSPRDANGYSLVFAATNSPEVNRLVTELAQAGGSWCNDASCPEASDFHTVSHFRRGPITVAVSTGGESPVLAAHLRRQLESCLGSEYAELAGLTEKLAIPLRLRGEFWRQVLAGDALEKLRSGQIAEAEIALGHLLSSLDHS